MITATLSKISRCLLPLLALAAHLSALEPTPKFAPTSGDTIVFLGDSITAQCLYTQYVEHYFHTRFPQTKLHFHNAGVSGDTTADALARFDRDVATYKPKYVTVLLGMNDGSSKTFEPALFDTYRADMEKLVGKIKAIGATPILLTPTMYDVRSAVANGKPDRRGRGGDYNGVLAFYGAWLREFAAEQGTGFADLYAPLNQFMQQSRRTKPDFTLLPDGIHPDPGGHMIVAYSLISDLGLSKRSSTIEISRDPQGSAVPKTTGGKISDARYNDTGIEFTFLPAGLPMSVPDDAKTGAALIPLGHRLSYEALTVHALPPGRYQLSINGQPIGEYSADLLGAKLELESNERTPQYQQSVRVAELNARRNTDIILPLRDLWRALKTLERTRGELAAAPGDAALQKRLTAYERKLAGFDGQVGALDAKSRQMEDDIYQAAQPQPLHFKITRAAAPSH